MIPKEAQMIAAKGIPSPDSEWRVARSKEDAESRRSAGILFGSGLVGGEGLLGVGIAGYAVAMGEKPAGVGFEWAGAAAPFVGLGLFCLLVVAFTRAARGR